MDLEILKSELCIGVYMWVVHIQGKKDPRFFAKVGLPVVQMERYIIQK